MHGTGAVAASEILSSRREERGKGEEREQERACTPAWHGLLKTSNTTPSNTFSNKATSTNHSNPSK